MKNPEKTFFFLIQETILPVKKFLLENLGEYNFKRIVVLKMADLPKYFLKIQKININSSFPYHVKFFFMYLAFKKSKQHAEILKNFPANMELINELLDVYESFSINTNYKKILINNNILCKKIKDLGTIFNEYDVLKADKYFDRLDILNFVKNTNLGKNFHKKYEFLINNFYVFNTLEKEILRFLESLNISIGIFVDKENSKKFVDGKVVYNKIDLSDVDKKNILLNNDKKIHFFSFKTVYDECEFVYKEIRRLILNEDYRLKDFLIVAPNYDDYKQILDRFLEKNSLKLLNDDYDFFTKKMILRTIICGIKSKNKLPKNCDLVSIYDVLKINPKFSGLTKSNFDSCLNEIIGILNSILSDKSVDFDDIIVILESIFCNISQKSEDYLDKISIMNIENVSSFDNYRVVFFIGENHQENHVKSQIFNSTELKQMLDLGLIIEKYVNSDFLLQDTLKYRLLQTSSEKFFITFSNFDKSGNYKFPSDFVKEVLAFTKGKIISISEDDDSASKFKIPESKFKITTFKNETSVSISASQVESFFSCPFAYFCNYMLKLKIVDDDEFSPILYGNLVHYVLENVMVSYYKKGCRGDIKFLIKKYICDFLEKNNFNLKNNEFMIGLFSSNLKIIVENLFREFHQSNFMPRYFEAKISKNGDFEPLEIKCESGLKTKIVGKIDRVDIMKSKNFGKIVRIVDYKTGAKKFILMENLFGFNLQMIIYMSCVLKNLPESKFGGVLYKPASKKISSFKQSSSKNSEDDRDLQMNGLYPKYHEIIYGMEKDLCKKFISVNSDDIEKNSESAVTFEEFQVISNFAQKKISSFVDMLSFGNFAPKPINIKIGSTVKNACKYCDFWKICLMKNTDRPEVFRILKKSDVLRIMENGDVNFGNKEMD